MKLLVVGSWSSSGSAAAGAAEATSSPSAIVPTSVTSSPVQTAFSCNGVEPCRGSSPCPVWQRPQASDTPQLAIPAPRLYPVGSAPSPAPHTRSGPARPPGPPRFMADLCSFCVSFSLCAAGAVAGGREGRGVSAHPGLPAGVPLRGAARRPAPAAGVELVHPIPLVPASPLWRGVCASSLLLWLRQPPRPAGHPLSPLPLPFPLQTTTAGTIVTRRAAATPAPATSSSATAGAASPCTGPATGTTTAGTTVTRLTPTAPTRVRLGWPLVSPRGSQVLRAMGG